MLWEDERLPSSGHTCRAHISGSGCHIVPFAWERRSRLKGIGHGAAFSSWNSSDTQGWLLQRGAIRISLFLCSLTRDWGESIEQKAGPFVGQGIRALCKKDWAVRVVFGGKEVYSSSAKDFPNFLNHEWVERPFLWRDIVPWQHVCSLVYFAWHMSRLQWAQIVQSPHKQVIRQRGESLRDETWRFMYDTTDLLSERLWRQAAVGTLCFSQNWMSRMWSRPSVTEYFCGLRCAEYQ